jgi:hypothetical protein
MRTVIILISISIVLWILPLFKQYKTEYFLFFLILALADPVKLPLSFLFHLVANRFSWVVALFLLSSLINNLKMRKILLWVSLAAFVISIAFKFDSNIMMKIAFAIHIIILAKIIEIFFNRIFKLQSLNLFLSLLLFFELIYVFKYLAAILSFQSGGISWIIGGVSQMLFAILFAFININTKDFSLVRKLE